MKQKSNILVPFLLAPAFLALAARDEHPRFAPEEETSLSKRIEIASELVLDDMTMVANGQEMDAGMLGMEMTTTATQVVAVTDRYAAVSEGRPTRLVRTFDELSSETFVSMSNAMMGDQDADLEGVSDLEGLTVVFAWDDEEEEYSVSFGEGAEGDEELLEGLSENLDLRDLLPPGEVSEEDSWEIEAGALRDVFAPGGSVKIQPEAMGDLFGMNAPQPSPDQMLGDFEGDVSAQFTGTRDEDGVRVAVISLSVDVTSARDLTEFMEEMMAEMELPEGMDFEVEIESFDMEFTFEGEGELLWNLETGLLHSLALSGEVTQTMDTSMNINAGGMEQAIEQSMSFSGSHEVTITTED